MNYCDRCGQANDANYQFCRNCGNRIAQFSGQPEQDYSAPRPYAWKTDEYQTQAESRRGNLQQPYPQNDQFNYGGQITPSPQMRYMAGNYRCSFCGSSQPPIYEKRISTTGWIVFALLLVFIFPFFWIGLLIKEDVHTCPTCRNRVA